MVKGKSEILHKGSILKCYGKIENAHWFLLEDFKKANPVEVAEHAITRKIDKEVSFN